MSALNYVLDDRQVIVVTDSLASYLDRRPRSFQTKVFPLPHVNGVICGTGVFQLLLDWFMVVQQQLVARDVMFLSQVAAEQLPRLMAQYRDDDPEIGDSTIYHFGWDTQAGHFRGFAHRSTENFAVEEFERPRWAVKPGGKAILDVFEEAFTRTDSIVSAFIETVKAQRAADLALPHHQRVGIGGEVHFLALSPTSQFLWNCYRFDEFDAMFAAMLETLRRRENASPAEP